jgi:hypothetical protein
MPRTLTTAALTIAAALTVAVSANAEILPGAVPTRDEYVATVDPICQKNTNSNKPILKQARKNVKKDMLPAAGANFLRVSKNFGRSLRAIRAVPRPTADNARLEKWFKFLSRVKANLSKIGKALKEKNRVKASHEKIRAERSSNAANNVSFIYGFDHCRLTPAQFR